MASIKFSFKSVNIYTANLLRKYGVDGSKVHLAFSSHSEETGPDSGVFTLLMKRS